MINKQAFERLRKEMQKQDQEREQASEQARDLISLSKKVIYSVQRNEPDLKAIKELQQKAKSLNAESHNGNYKVAMQEYVEAMAFYSYYKDKNIPTDKELGVDAEHYLLGLCDLSGELTRLAINSGIKGDYNKIKEIKEFLEEIYAEMSMFDFRNSELRKKYDQIKWSLEKLESAVFELAVKGKLQK